MTRKYHQEFMLSVAELLGEHLGGAVAKAPIISSVFKRLGQQRTARLIAVLTCAPNGLLSVVAEHTNTPATQVAEVWRELSRSMSEAIVRSSNAERN